MTIAGTLERLALALVVVGFGAATSNASAQAVSGGRGFPVSGPWVSFYGELDEADVDQIASTFRIINLDADPDMENVTDAQIQALQAGGANVVISYLNIGSSENYRSYYREAEQTGALTTVYDEEYPDEKWANLGNADYQDLIVDYVAQRLVDRGVDGFYLDNLEVVEHGARAKYGPCDEDCARGGLDLVEKLRIKFPNKLIVMQNATSDVTRTGVTTRGTSFPSLLDGVSHEEVYRTEDGGVDDEALEQMRQWRALNLEVGGRPFWLAVEEYVGECSPDLAEDAAEIRQSAADDGFNAYVTDESGEQQSACFDLLSER